MHPYRRIVIGFLACTGFVARGQTVTEEQLRQRIFETAKAQVGVVERRNRNDHPRITQYNKSIGLPATAPYCASGLYWCYAQNGVRLPLRSPGTVRGWFADKSHIVYSRRMRGNQRTGPKPNLMDAVSIFDSHVEGLAQSRWDDDADEVLVLGFNTTAGRGTKGGVYLVHRKVDQIKAISNHLTPYLQSKKANL